MCLPYLHQWFFFGQVWENRLIHFLQVNPPTRSFSVQVRPWILKLIIKNTSLFLVSTVNSLLPHLTLNHPLPHHPKNFHLILIPTQKERNFKVDTFFCPCDLDTSFKSEFVLIYLLCSKRDVWLSGKSKYSSNENDQTCNKKWKGLLKPYPKCYQTKLRLSRQFLFKCYNFPPHIQCKNSEICEGKSLACFTVISFSNFTLPIPSPPPILQVIFEQKTCLKYTHDKVRKEINT